MQMHTVEMEQQKVKYRDSLDSLHSARIIQLGMLPKERHFKRLFEEYFTLYLPKDSISGDFYWVGKKHNLNYLVVGDCTGHGVPAALLSVLALNLLEYVIMNKGIKKTNKILQEVDKKFIESFKGHNAKNYDNLWIDLSIICIEAESKKIYFSSANRKMLLVKPNKDHTIYKGSRYPIGGWQVESSRNFEVQCIPYEENDMVYIGSDGFQDQIGGPKNKKYKSKNLHQLLVQNSQLPLNIQKKELENEFTNWKKDGNQTDDICLVALRL